MKAIWAAVVTLLLSFTFTLAEAQVDCTMDQLNPACVPYVLKHSVAQPPVLTAWPMPPLESLPLVPLARPTAIALVPPPAVIQPTPMVSFAPQPPEIVQPTIQPQSPRTPGCDQNCYSQLGANGATAIIGIVGAVRQHQKNKQFCAANPASCANDHPCSFEPSLEGLADSVREYIARGIPDPSGPLNWLRYMKGFCELRPRLCYHDLDGNVRSCSRR